MILDGKTNFFPKENNGFGQENQLFPRKKVTIFWETMRPNSKKMAFFGFP